MSHAYVGPVEQLVGECRHQQEEGADEVELGLVHRVVEQAHQHIEQLELTHGEDCQVEGTDRAEDHKVRVDRVVARRIPDTRIRHDHYHAIDMGPGNPE